MCKIFIALKFAFFLQPVADLIQTTTKGPQPVSVFSKDIQAGIDIQILLHRPKLDLTVDSDGVQVKDATESQSLGAVVARGKLAVPHEARGNIRSALHVVPE